MIARALVAVAGLGLALGAHAEGDKPAAKPLRVALDKLRAAGVSPVIAETVEERVCAALGEVAGIEVVCPSDVAAASQLARSAAVFGECKSDDCMKRVEDVMAADRRVGGAVEKGEKGFVLSLQVSGPTGAGPKVIERLPEDLDAILARVPVAVKKLFP